MVALGVVSGLGVDDSVGLCVRVFSGTGVDLGVWVCSSFLIVVSGVGVSSKDGSGIGVVIGVESGVGIGVGSFGTFILIFTFLNYIIIIS
jgi:hypothetical protein